MTRTTVRRRSVALSGAIAASALFLAGGAAVVGSANAATAGGFSTVATIPFTAQSEASPADGVVYVAGVSGTAIKVRRYALDGTAQDVAVAASGTATQLATSNGTTWLLVTGGASASLWRIDATTATRVAVPAIAPTTSFQATTIAADSGLLWVSGYAEYPTATGTAHSVDALRFDGTSWTAVPYITTPQVRTWSYAKGSTLFLPTFIPVGPYGQYPVARIEGTTWTDAPYTYLREWTLASADDYTMWGSTQGPFPATAPYTGTCTRVVNNAVVPGGCVAPAMPVAQAVRLADGRVVLAGSDTTVSGGTAPGAFMLVEKDGATPQPIPGSVGSTTVDLAAASSGTNVWAITQTGTAYTLQRATLDPTSSSTPTPTPTTSPTPTPTPTPSPTVTPKHKHTHTPTCRPRIRTAQGAASALRGKSTHC